MRIARIAPAALALAPQASAFQLLSGIQRTAGQVSKFPLSRRLRPSSREGTSPTTTATSSFLFNFERFFGGGAYSSGIDYESLPHPCPELADLALSDRVAERSARDPGVLAATFAGGCFWGLELTFQRVRGVAHTAVGYTRGEEGRPSYSAVCTGSTGHTEAVAVYYRPEDVTYEELLGIFFGRVNPTTVNGQGKDFGPQYRTGVYYHSEDQRETAQRCFDLEKERYTSPIATELKQAAPFWPAEKYHQKYLERGGRSGVPQSAEKDATYPIDCYG